MRVYVRKGCVVGVGTSSCYPLPFGFWLIITRTEEAS